MFFKGLAQYLDLISWLRLPGDLEGHWHRWKGVELGLQKSLLGELRLINLKYSDSERKKIIF